MIFTLTDRQFNVLDAYETDDYLIGIYTGFIIKTLDLNVLVTSEHADHWIEGNYIMCEDATGYKYWFTIRDVEDGMNQDEKQVTCYSGTLDIVNEDANPVQRPSVPQPFEYYFNRIFFDTGIEIGVNEIDHMERALEFTSENASNVEMLQYVLNGFDRAEADLAVEFDGSVPTKVVLNVYRRIGKEDPQEILTDEDDSLTELDRTGSIAELATCLNPVGRSEDPDVDEITLVGRYFEERDEEGNLLYYSPEWSPRVFSVVARQNYFVDIPGKDNGEFDGYINRRYQSEAQSQETLWTESVDQLKKIDHPQIEYNARGFINCRAGDNIQIVSHQMKPPIKISARVMEYKFNDDDPSLNEYKFGNYEALESNIDDLSALMAEFKKSIIYIESQSVSYVVSNQGSEPPEEGWSEDKPELPLGMWLWTRTVTHLSNGDRTLAYSVSYAGTDGSDGEKGETGSQGPQGVQGPRGADGQTTYTWIRYADNINGGGISNSPIGKTHIGFAYNKTTATESNVASDYTWALIKGEDGSQGPPGVQGPKGEDGETTYTWVKYSANSDGSGLTNLPQGNTKYIGIATNKTTPTESNNPSDYTWSKFVGEDGVGIQSITEYYTVHTAGTGITAGGTGWSTSVPTMTETNRYLWNYERIVYTNGSSIDLDARVIGVFGQRGNTGSTGTSIDKIEEFYLTTSSASGVTTSTSGWSTNLTAPTPTNKYIWNYERITYKNPTSTEDKAPRIIGVYGDAGPEGPRGPQGATGERGPRGDTGTSVTGVTEYYLASSTSTGVTTSTNGWSTEMQTMTTTNRYLWNYEKIHFSDGTTQDTLPVIMGIHGTTGQTGETGRSITGITNYYLATSASSGVTRSTTGWTTSMQPTTNTNKYLWNYERVTWSSGTTTTYVEPIIIGVHGEVGPKGDKGDTGDRGPKGETGSSGPKGDTGESGQNAITGYLTNESIVVSANSAGTVASWTGANGYFRVMDGNEQVMSGLTFSVASSSGVTTSINSNGYYSITGMSADFGSAVFQVIYKGITIQKIMMIAKSRQGPQGATGPTGAKGDTGSTGATGPQGPPTGVVEQNTVPGTSVRYPNMLWRNTGASGYINGATYRWTGSSWVLFMLNVANLSVENLAAITANLGTVTAGKILSNMASNRYTELDLANGKYQSRGIYSRPNLSGPASNVDAIVTVQDGSFTAEETNLGINRRVRVGAGDIDIHMSASEWAKLTGSRFQLQELLSGLGGFSALTANSIEFGDNGGVGTRLTKNGLTVNGDDIFSEGTGANGSWIRFHNGIQICWHTISGNVGVNQTVGSLFRSDVFDWIFPASFISNPHVFLAGRRTAGNLLWGADNGETNTVRANNLRLLSPVSGSSGRLIGFCIGYWKTW